MPQLNQQTVLKEIILSRVSTDGSITSSQEGVSLDNDSDSPGANKVYGTDASGNKGWQLGISSASIASALGAQTANKVYAGPSSGDPANPGFRALVAADIPPDFEAKVDSLSVVTSGGTITLNFGGKTQRIFVGDAAFTGAKTIALSNNSAALVFDLHIDVTTSCTLTLPASFTMDSADNRWNTSTQVLTITGTGKYEISGSYDSRSAEWRVKASPDGGYV